MRSGGKTLGATPQDQSYASRQSSGRPCQAKFLTSTKFLTCCFSVILLLRIKKLHLVILFFDVCCVNQNILVRRQVPTIINYFKTLLRRKSNGLHQKTLLKHDLSNELAGVQMSHLKKHM